VTIDILAILICDNPAAGRVVAGAVAGRGVAGRAAAGAVAGHVVAGVAAAGAVSVRAAAGIAGIVAREQGERRGLTLCSRSMWTVSNPVLSVQIVQIAQNRTIRVGREIRSVLDVGGLFGDPLRAAVVGFAESGPHETAADYIQQPRGPLIIIGRRAAEDGGLPFPNHLFLCRRDRRCS